MRKLSDNFLRSLKTGFLSSITEEVIADADLDLEIRDNYINVYYKGNSLLKLTEAGKGLYKTAIHEKFSRGLSIPPEITTGDAAEQLVRQFPDLKHRIDNHGKRSLEIEFEQLLIRSNNFEPRNSSEYFIVDRQYVTNAGRFDLLGVFWDSTYRRQNQEVPLCLIEIKYALNSDISELHRQLERYYEATKRNATQICEETESLFRQKLELGLYQQPSERLAAMKTLTIARDHSQFQFVLVLVDYNHYSHLLNYSDLTNLPFASQIRVFHCGFAMWQQNVKPIALA